MSGNHQNGFNDAEKSQIKEIVREVFDAIKTDELLRLVRDEARVVASAESHTSMAAHVAACPFKADVQATLVKYALLGLTIVGASIVTIGAIGYGIYKAYLAHKGVATP
jgi:hypothetical protein